MNLGMLVYPHLTQLDLTGPWEVLSRIPGARMHLLWKEKGIVEADSGLGFSVTTRLDECPPLDLVFVPGGYGQMSLMTDEAVLGFLRAQAERARWITSVCTGALVLGAAGLLEGYDAATHWAYMDLLPAFGARPVEKRVVVDRNRITAGGVTAGIDFGLRVLAEIAGEDFAKAVQLGLEYDPEPPYACGHPHRAEPQVIAAVRAELAARVSERQAQVDALRAKSA